MSDLDTRDSTISSQETPPASRKKMKSLQRSESTNGKEITEPGKKTMMSSITARKDGNVPKQNLNHTPKNVKADQASEVCFGAVSSSSLSGASLRRCSVCGAAVGRKHFRQHVLVHHLSLRPFRCHHCHYAAKQRDSMLYHVRHRHAEEAESFSTADVEAEVSEWRRLCFGPSRATQPPRTPCAKCRKDVDRSSLRHHAASHLGVILHGCRLCPYTTQLLSVSVLHRHVRRAHKVEPSDAHCRSRSDLSQVVGKAVMELFPS